MQGFVLMSKEKNYFWKLHDYMFDNQGKLDSNNLKKVAGSFQGFDGGKFNDCLDKSKYMDKN